MNSDEMIEELYLAAYSRFPDDDEREYAIGLVESSENRRVVLEDMMWAMINSPEFSIQN